ncbi:hypothetical protein BHM03_00035796 [Ensete ventricosum]|nr:hypothetical protein BHM03_00035796 [Ensete ventricosum]
MTQRADLTKSERSDSDDSEWQQRRRPTTAVTAAKRSNSDKVAKNSDGGEDSGSDKMSTTEHDEREVGYSLQAEEAQLGLPTGKKSHKERLSTVETRLDILEANLEELYQVQGRLFGVESSQEKAKSRMDRVESLADRLTEDTKDSVRHLHEVMAELTAKGLDGSRPQYGWSRSDPCPSYLMVQLFFLDTREGNRHACTSPWISGFRPS